jgi:hypothetical protein
MFYAVFAVWVMLILLAGMVAYRLCVRLLGPRRTDWILLPGSVVSELAYSIGLLLAGRPAAGGLVSRSADTAEPGQRPTGAYRFVISMLAALTSLAGGVAALGGTTNAVGEPMVRSVVVGDVWQGRAGDIPSDWAAAKDGLRPAWVLPRDVPDDVDECKDLLRFQGKLLVRLGQAVVEQDWLDWRTFLFAYLSICLSIRLGAVRHDRRAALAAAAALLGAITLVGAAWDGMEDIIGGLKLWSLLTYVWAVLLAVLAAVLSATAAAALIRAFRGNASGDG